MNDFLTFKKMITPIVIQVIFWLMILVCFIGAIISFAQGTGASVLSGLFMLILGPIFVRVYCELIIVVFRVRDLLEDIKTNTAPRT